MGPARQLFDLKSTLSHHITALDLAWIGSRTRVGEDRHARIAAFARGRADPASLHLYEARSVSALPLNVLPTVTDVCPAASVGSSPHRVYVVVPPNQILELADGTEISFGRAADSTIMIDDPRVSRRHAVIRRSAGDVLVRDLGSRNGTVAGGTVLHAEEARVVAGDWVRVGPAEVIVAAESRAAAPAESAASFDGIIVAEPAMQKVFRVARKVAQASAAIVITGETGSGKEVVAAQIHHSSPRAHGPFVRLNCAAIPESLLESELFGHERGAYTGADRRKPGFVEAAIGGTLFLDEIGDMPLATQVKLLRVLESKAITRLGGTKEIAVDIRVICATHRDLKEEVAAGRFREDLFYRISTFKLHVPPLRERPLEIMLLAELFGRHFADAMGVVRPTFSEAASKVLLAYAWPGNVRELRNAVEHAVVMAENGGIDVEHLPAETLDLRQDDASEERRVLTEALKAEGWNQTRAARRLGINRRVLIYRMQKLNVSRPV